MDLAFDLQFLEMDVRLVQCQKLIEEVKVMPNIYWAT
jgi:hypothetical protein